MAYRRDDRLAHCRRLDSEGRLSDGRLCIPDPDPAIRFLMQLEREGLLDTYILPAPANEEISRDYSPYRAENRGAIMRHLSRYGIHDGK